MGAFRKNVVDLEKWCFKEQYNESIFFFSVKHTKTSILY